MSRETDTDKEANNQLSTMLAGKTITDVTICSGDAQHSPHISISMGGVVLHVAVDDGDLVIGVTHPHDTQTLGHLAHTSAADLHESPNAEQ